MAQIGTPDKKPFSDRYAKNARKILLKVNEANEMALLWRLWNIQYPRNKLIPYKSRVMWKTQPKLFEKCANYNIKDKKPFSKQIMSRQSFLCGKTARKLLLKAKYNKEIPLLSRSLKLKNPRNKLIPYSIFQKKARSKELMNSVILQKHQGQTFQNQTISKESLYCQEIWN